MASWRGRPLAGSARKEQGDEMNLLLILPPVAAAAFFMMGKNKRQALKAICVMTFLSLMIGSAIIAGMYLRPYIEYADMLSAIEHSPENGRIEKADLYLLARSITTITAVERTTDIYDSEQLEIRVFLGPKNVAAETAAEIGEAIKTIVDAQMPERINEHTGLEKRVHIVAYPVWKPDIDLWDSDVVGSLQYYRIWGHEQKTFEWILDGGLWDFYPMGHHYTPFEWWWYRTSELWESYYHGYVNVDYWDGILKSRRQRY
jgi:hypothetical protein